MEQIIAVMNSVYPLDNETITFLKSKLIKHSLPKKQLIHYPPHICKRIFFIEKGLVRGYYFKDGKEHTNWFFKENDIVISIISFFNQMPSDEYIETLEDSILWSLNYSDLQYLYKNSIAFNTVGRVLTEKYYCLSEIRNYHIRMKSIEEKYSFLLTNIPNIFNRISSKHISSYLGIEPETLSRIRSRIK